MTADLPTDKTALRAAMKKRRVEFYLGLTDAVRNICFRRPPRPLVPLIEDVECIGIYVPGPGEVPTGYYQSFFWELGKTVAMPVMADREAPIAFRRYDYGDKMEVGPFGPAQPLPSAPLVEPELIFAPLVAFDASLARLGQGGGHYDRYFADHPAAFRIGLGWSVQEVDKLPTEPHDQRLDAVVTEAALFGPEVRRQ